MFLSYSHDDVVWAQRFRVLLKPLIRRKPSLCGTTPQIRIGDEWHPAIEDAIGRSRVALVLVSPDSLASDYVMVRELPALRSNVCGSPRCSSPTASGKTTRNSLRCSGCTTPTATVRSVCTPGIPPSATATSTRPVSGS